MKILVTGGAGFIGSHLVDALLARGDEVVVLDDLSTGRLENLSDETTLHRGDVAELDDVKRAAEGCEAIYHLAAIASVQRTVEEPLRTNAVNMGGALNALQAARAVGAKRVVFASSAAVYGDRSDGAVREEEKPNPQSPYAVEKLCAEHYVRIWGPLFGLETVALRFFNVFGPRQDPSSPYSGVVSIFADRLFAGQRPTIFGDGEQTRDFVAVADVVQALLRAGEAPSGLVCNVARGERTSLNQLYTWMQALIGGPEQPAYGPARAGDIRHSLADVTRLTHDLGFTPTVSVRNGLERLVASLRP